MINLIKKSLNKIIKKIWKETMKKAKIKVDNHRVKNKQWKAVKRKEKK